MKKLSLLLVLLLCITVVSCSKDEKKEEDTQGLAGEWKLEEFEYQSTTTVKAGDTEDVSTFTGTATDIDVALLFNALPNNTWENNGSYTFETVTTANGQTQTEKMTYENVVSTGSYTVEGNLLKLGYDQHIGALAIKEGRITRLTDTELVLDFQFSETSSVSDFEVELMVQGVQRYSR